MRLVVATPLYPPEIGGPATYVRFLEEGLPPRGIEVEVVKFAGVRRLPTGIRHCAYYRRVRRALRAADLALALDPVSVGLPTMLAAWRERKPYVVKVVGDYAWEQGRQRFGITEDLDAFLRRARAPLPVALLRYLETRVARSATRVIVPSDYMKRVVSAWGVPARAIAVIYNAVKIDAPGAVPEGVTKLPRPLLVTAGRLVSWKRVEGVIDALAAGRASLAVVGDGPLREALEARAREKMPGRAAFTGALSHADTLATIAAADLFVLNSTYEGLSHLLIEALALGKAVVAADVGGNAEVIENADLGTLVSVADPGALARAIDALLANAPLRTRLGVNAKLSAARFSESAMLDATAAYLRRAVPLTP